MVIGSKTFQRQVWLVFLGLCVSVDAQAAFGGLMPLSHSGQLSYSYSYADSAGSQSETTNLLLGVSSSGYIWRPWFANTSFALNVGLTSTQSNTSSSEGTTGTGSFNLGVFPRSRFPFTLNFSRTDSRTQKSFDVAQMSGEVSYRVTRLTMRQNYRPRANNQLYDLWYSTTQFDGGSFGSESVAYGLDYRFRASYQSVAATASHSGVGSGASTESTADVVSVSHVYTPSAELGVNSLVSYVEIDSAGVGGATIDTQAFSSFFWRPEHRAVAVSGGVRLSEIKSSVGVSKAASRSLNTNLGIGYRATRSLNFNANLSVGTSDSGAAQSLSTLQTMNVSYTGGRRQWSGFSHSWQWGSGISNSATRTELGGVVDTVTRQGISTSIGHNLGKTWPLGHGSSLSTSFSQSGSGSKSSESEAVSSTVSHGASAGWNKRGRRGSSYFNARFTDSRSFGGSDTVFNEVGLSYVSDYVFNRISSMNGNLNYQVSQNSSENELLGKTESGTRNLSGGLTYRNARPFGIYNLQFTSFLQGSKQIGSAVPTTTLRWEGTFRYSLGLLSTLLSFRASDSPGGNIAKSMIFQATRSF